MTKKRDRSIPPRHSYGREEVRTTNDLSNESVPLYLQAPVPTPPSESFEIPEVPPTTTETIAIVDDVIPQPNQDDITPIPQGDATMEDDSPFVSDLARAVFILTSPDVLRKAENLGFNRRLFEINPNHLPEWHSKIALVLSTGDENNAMVQVAKLQLDSLYLELCKPEPNVSAEAREIIHSQGLTGDEMFRGGETMSLGEWLTRRLQDGGTIFKQN